MVTALQIALLLILIALIGIIIGYLFGKLACKKHSKDQYFEKNDYCETDYVASSALLDDISEKPSILSDNNVATVSKEEDVAEEANSANTEEINSDTLSIEAQGLLSESEDRQSSEDANANSESLSAKSEEADEKTDNVEEIIDSAEENTEDSKEDIKPPVLTEPRDGKADNLCRIKGIGFVIEEKLHNLGVFHFDQIAAWTEEEIKWVDSHLAFSGRIIREDWIGQAKKLAAGEETEFSQRVDKGKVATSRKTKENEK